MPPMDHTRMNIGYRRRLLAWLGWSHRSQVPVLIIIIQSSPRTEGWTEVTRKLTQSPPWLWVRVHWVEKSWSSCSCQCPLTPLLSNSVDHGGTVSEIDHLQKLSFDGNRRNCSGDSVFTNFKAVVRQQSSTFTTFSDRLLGCQSVRIPCRPIRIKKTRVWHIVITGMIYYWNYYNNNDSLNNWRL